MSEAKIQRRVDVFDAALLEVTHIRGEVYGSPLLSFEKIATMKDRLKFCENPSIRHALEMICVKIVRIAGAPDSRSMDSVIDVAGYARTIAMILDEEENQ